MSEIWHPTGFVNFHSTEPQTVYFERGEVKCNASLPQINFLLEVDEGELLHLLSLNYNHGWKVFDYKFNDNELIATISNSIVHPKEIQKPKRAKQNTEDIERRIDQFITERGLWLDNSDLENKVAEVILVNPAAVEDYVKGEKSAVGFLVGQILKSNKNLDPKTVKETVESQLCRKSKI